MVPLAGCSSEYQQVDGVAGLRKKGAADVVICWQGGGDPRRWHDAINCTSTDACMALFASSSVIPRRFEHSNLGDRGGKPRLRKSAD